MSADQRLHPQARPGNEFKTDNLLEPSVMLSQFRRLRAKGALTPEVVTRLTTQAAAMVIEQYMASEQYCSEAVTLLCEVAQLDDPSLSRLGVRGLFTQLVEPLGDAFSPQACALYNRLFTQVIQHCRSQPDGAALDRQLRHFGLMSQDDLLARAAWVRRWPPIDAAYARNLKMAFVLSRVTLGADVAVTSVVLAALKEAFPAVTIRLIGSVKSAELFAADPRVQVCTVDYPRGGSLVGRLESWCQLVEVLQRQTAGLDTGEYLIIDPDSRLTQLGLLPLVDDERGYRFFESRSYTVPGVQRLSALTAHWLRQALDRDDLAQPYCAPSAADVVAAKRLLASLRTHARRPIISVNFGVGANPAKRLPDPFEFHLLTRLLAAGMIVILDKGGDAEEAGRIEHLVASLAAAGFRVQTLEGRPEGDRLPGASTAPQLLTWQGGIGGLAGLIAESTAYIGYDSAGQHIATALGVPTIDIFTGFSSPRMPERWAPAGPGPVHMQVVENPETCSAARLDALIDDILAHLPAH